MRQKVEKIKKVKIVQEKVETKRVFPVKILGKWDSNVIVNDAGLKPYINLDSRILPRSAGKHRKSFHKSKSHIIERLALHLIVAGHSGKSHKLTSGIYGGKFYGAMKTTEKALSIIAEKTQKNPIEVLVRAIERSALREEIISYQVGSVMAREAVISAPQRRVDKSLRFFAQGSYKKSMGKKAKLSEVLAEEIIAASEGKDCFAIKEKERIEREAAGAR